VKSPIAGKFCLFNKKYITAMNYGPGAHSCKPEGSVVYSKKQYRLYHYNSLGEDFTIEKFKIRSQRSSQENIENRWGSHYFMTAQEIRDEYVEERKKATKIR
jgi:hypothetical protein